MIEGESASIGVTERHPFRSLDRDEWIPAGELHRGERVLVAGGTAAVGNWERAGEEPVYIIEVEGDHCYRVGQQGVLVHNASVCVKEEIGAFHTGKANWLIIQATGAMANNWLQPFFATQAGIQMLKAWLEKAGVGSGAAII